MRVRDSGMPDEAYWESLFDPAGALDGFPFLRDSTKTSRLLELGCGYGTFTVELAQRFAGEVDTVDIDPEMVARTRKRLSARDLKNASVFQGNFVADDLPDRCRDYDAVVLFHIMHLEEPEELIRRILPRIVPGGVLAFLHWRPDRETPRGPDLGIRPTLGDYQRWSRQFALSQPVVITLHNCPHHFAVQCQKSELS
ncbi:class I SAM-dependent methyltransferase [Aporhodopirellula aestuarii]|uniref:Class I SAM-dependent methyltransferase n=1 Tax=Aporhodopirellula aestuarii TaxID=2950107 RepID=A0ABT0U7Z9_9BACT|nr:class I SAM-dependent methyltransferase [Aporhodopirellula aestuarii]MCM2372932.1 class I SAM-dependent methyltransferase [Aporhodopirellula aestuarii]